MHGRELNYHSRLASKTRGALVCLFLLLAPSIATASTASDLTDACNALLASAVSRPYGLGWPGEASEISSRQPKIGLGPGQTPAAALVLFRAGRVLSEPKFTDAAIAAAHGIARCQLDTGKIGDQGIFATFPVGQDVSVGARDRTTTSAALGLFLEILRNQPTRDERIVSAAGRAANWLTRQQLHDGAWPTEMKFGDSSHATRYLRLDTTDWRDCTLAMLEAGQILERRELVHNGEGAANVLVLLQLHDPKAAWAAAWAPLYHVNGSPVKDLDKAFYALNSTASLHAAQTLVGSYLLNYDRPTMDALTRFASTMTILRTPTGDWYRLYGLPESPGLPATRSGETHLPRLFEPATSQPTDPSGLAPPGMAELLETIALLQKSNVGPLTQLPSGAGSLSRFRRDQVYEEIASTLCGVTATPFGPLASQEADDPGGESPQDSAVKSQILRIQALLMSLPGGGQ
jgi:hypothetical protein